MYLSISYSKTTGEIYTCNSHSSKQSMAIFGKFEIEMTKEFNLINIEYDEFIYKNIELFKVDLEAKNVILKDAQLTKYSK